LAINDLNACLPQSVTVAYQTVASDGFTVLAPTPYVVTLASLALPEFPADMVGFPGSKLFHCKTLATLAGGGTPTNDASLRTSAQAIATVYYRWLARATTDTAFAGVCPWSSSGLEGEVEWLHASDRIETRVTRPPWLEHQDELLTFGVPNAAPQGYPQLLFAQVCMGHQFALPTTGEPAFVTTGVWYDTGFGLLLPSVGSYLLQADVYTLLYSVWNNELGPDDPSNHPQAEMFLGLFDAAGNMLLGSLGAQVVGAMNQFTADSSGALASTTLQYVRVSDLSGAYAGRGIPGAGLWEPLCAAIVGGTGEGSGTGTGGGGGGGGGVVETPCCGNMLPATLYAYVSAQEFALCGAPAGTSGAIALTYADGTWTGSGDYLGTPVTITFTCNGTSCQDFTGTVACDSASIPMSWSPTRSGDCTCDPLYVFLVDTETGNVANMYITE
jgi:hypothetical protein